MEAGIAQGLLGFMAYLAAVPLLLRLRSSGEPATLVLAAGFALWVLSLAALLAAGQKVNFWAFSISYWFFTLCFLMAFGALYKSVSLRMVAHLLKGAERSETYGALERQVLEESYKERLAILVEKGYADRVEDRFVLTGKGIRIARWTGFLQSVFRIARSG